MKNILRQTQLIFLISITFISCTSVHTDKTDNNKYDLAIENVVVFDSKNKQLLRNKTILIKADTIAGIVNASQKSRTQQTIQGHGRLVTPGFIDTHTHILQTYGSRKFERNYTLDDEVLESYKKLITRQFLTNGVTTIFDMGQPEPWIEKTLELQNNPGTDFPNVYINGSSTISDPGPNRFIPLHHEPVANAEEGRAKVQKYAKLGIKHMKLYSRLKEVDMKPIVEEANKFGITLNAHVDNNVVTIPQAMDLGVKNFEHFFTVIPSILEFWDNINLLDEKYGPRPDAGIDGFAADLVFYFGVIKDDPDLDIKLNSLLERMANENVTISTALNVLATGADRSHTFSTFESLPPRNKPMTKHTATQTEQVSKAFDVMMEYMKTAHDKGVKIRIGTDTRYGGDAFISELLLFAEAGFPIEDILQIATINAAEAMKIDNTYGAIEVGKKADLILFDKSPFDDYRNFEAEKTIVKGGKIFELKESVPYVLLEKIENDGLDVGLIWFDKNKNNYGALDEAEVNEIIYQLFAKGQVKEAIAVSKVHKQLFPTSEKVYNGLSENDINTIGYYYLEKDAFNQAQEIFQFNVDQNPTSANTYDSLGELYLQIGNKELALENYKKAVELNPTNFSAVNIINEIEGIEITVEDAVLKSYVGEYEINPELVFTISKEGAKIFWQQNGRGNKLELKPITTERFLFLGTNQTIVFKKNENGKVTGLTLDQNGRLTELTKITL